MVRLSEEATGTGSSVIGSLPRAMVSLPPPWALPGTPPPRPPPLPGGLPLSGGQACRLQDHQGVDLAGRHELVDFQELVLFVRVAALQVARAESHAGLPLSEDGA